MCTFLSQSLDDRYLDISNNNLYISSTPYESLITRDLQYLSIAHNNFGDSPTVEFVKSSPTLTSLDISYTGLKGQLALRGYPSLTSVKVRGNAFSGNLDLNLLNSLSLLDISHNLFEFDISTMAQLPLLMSFNARNNSLYGSLVLDGYPSLRFLDLSSNHLNYHPDLASIRNAYTLYSLELLNITDNPYLPRFDDLQTSLTGLKRTSSSAPSPTLPSVTCFSVGFSDRYGLNFLFDESLFSYAQCDCSERHYGLPPHSCFACPSVGASLCGGDNATISRKFFAYLVTENGEPTTHRIEAEPCAAGSSTNCNGVEISAHRLKEVSIHTILASQCARGSEGRLCSKCKCDSPGSCYYPRGPYVITLPAPSVIV